MPAKFHMQPAKPDGFDCDLVNAHALLTRASVKDKRVSFPDGQAYRYLGELESAKKEHKRNLELGVFSTDPAWVARLQSLFDSFWMGTQCESCALRQKCPDPIEVT